VKWFSFGLVLTKRRKQRCRRRRREFKDRVSIHDRPKIIERRRRIGDWESDTVEGIKSQSAIATHIDRKSRYCVATKLKDRKSDTFMQATIGLFNKINPDNIHTFTVDNGSEFSAFKKLEKATKAKVYFADPYSPWQRGTNENTNGLIRRFFPKGTNFNDVSEHMLQSVIDYLNHRPRKCLDFRTPYEVFFKTTTVALRD